MSVFKAIAAMSLNRVIGNGLEIPWHLPEDFKWFKQTTMGQVLVMGRRTFDSIGRALPGRETMVLTRGDFSHPDVTVIRSLDEVAPRLKGRTAFIAGGAAPPGGPAGRERRAVDVAFPRVVDVDGIDNFIRTPRDAPIRAADAVARAVRGDHDAGAAAAERQRLVEFESSDFVESCVDVVQGEQFFRCRSSFPVSYTHLTLPTNREV